MSESPTDPTRPLRVLMFRSVCDTGGLASWMLIHARALQRLGVECHFFFCDGSRRIPEFEKTAPTTVAPIEAFLDLVATDAYDVLHIPGGDPVCELLTLVPVKPRIVATNHGGISSVWQSTNCHARTAVSRAMAELDQPLTDVLVEAVPNGVDCDRFTPPAAGSLRVGDAPIVAWVGRTASIVQKDFPRFLRIAALLAQRGVRLWVADAHDADWTIFERLGCPRPPIERWECVPYEHMPDFYQDVAASGGALLMTSPFEGFGLAAAEAAACGLTTIAPDVLGLRESVQEGLNGTHYPADASDADVAARVLAWIGEWTPDRAATAAATARSRFSAAVMASRYLEIYRRPHPLKFTGELPADAAREDPVLKATRGEQGYWQRASALTRAALRLSEVGRRRLTLRVVAHVVRTSPRVLARPATRNRLIRAFVNIRPGAPPHR